MELNSTFASNLRQRFKYNSHKNGVFLYPFGSFQSKDTTVSFPLWTTILVMIVWSLARFRRTDGFPFYGLFNSNTMPKTNGIKASAKRSNTSFTSSHETAVNHKFFNLLFCRVKISRTFAMTKDISRKDSCGYNFISIRSQLSQLRYSDLPLWLSIVVHLDGVLGRIKGANRFLFYAI